MKRMLLPCAAAVLGLGGCSYDPAAEGYRVVYADNFDALDESVWNTTRVDGGATVANGIATLTDVPGGSYNYIGSFGPYQDGPPHDKDEVNYPEMLAFEEGYFEARMRFTRSAWAWPVFWLFSADGTEATQHGTECNELRAEWDIMEAGLNNADGTRPAYDHFYSVLHRNTRVNDDVNGGMYCGETDEPHTFVPVRASEDVDFSDWHVWGGRWTADQVCVYLDGLQLGCLDTHDTTSQPMTLMFAIGYHEACGDCGPQPAELTLDVDWVRVSQLP